MFLNFREFVRNMVREEVTYIDQRKEAINKIEKYLEKYKEIKIGKTSDIKKRFNQTYIDAGYTELIPIVNCINKKAMDDLEKELIDYFKDRIKNEQDGGGNFSYSNDYWIYIVVK